MRKGIGSHQSARALKDEWLTPPELVKSLGTFDLDPCSPIDRVWDTAMHHYTIEDDGLLQDWFGRVWCNPPYGRQMGIWMNKLALHGDGVGLIFARTDTQDFHKYIFPTADSIFFLEGRLHFHHADGSRAKANAGAPSCLVAYGENNSEAIDESNYLKGKHWYMKGNVFVIGVEQTSTKSWRILTEDAMHEFDGEATVSQVYDFITEHAPKKVQNNKHSREKIRQILGRYFTRVQTGMFRA